MSGATRSARTAPGARATNRVAAVLERETGMRVQSAQRHRLERAIGGRMRALSETSRADYAARVEGDPDEWRWLVPEVAVGETRFFRDRERWAAIEHAVIPDLIARRHGRLLRLWSAGCATGQEPFGLAMVCERLRARFPGLNVDILGSDINREALRMAGRAVYPRHAMRGLPPADQARFFEPCTEGFRVRPEVRARVRFEEINLLEWGGHPHPGPPFDLILCQRVLIYLSPEATERVLNALATALDPGGMLLVGHTETITPPVGCRLEWVGGSSGFRRADPEHAAAPEVSEEAAPAPGPDAHEVVRLAWEAAIGERYVEALSHLAPLPRTGAVLRLAAWIALCRGDRPGAANLVAAALAEAPTHPEPHFLAAMLALDAGPPEAAAAHLKRAVYLDPGFAPAHFHLATLAAAAGRAGEARRAWHTAERMSAVDAVRIRRYFGFDAEAFAEVCRARGTGREPDTA